VTVELVAVDEGDKSVLMNLIQSYQYDFSEICDLALSPHGMFVYPYLDAYFTEMAREPYFITVAGDLAGFALARNNVDEDCSWNVAEFFVFRGHRGQGVARGREEAARRLFARHLGARTLSFDHNNSPTTTL